MQTGRLGEIVSTAQWVAAVLLPAFVFVGRGLLGAELGWMSLGFLVYGPVLLVLLIPPILTRFDPVVRRARATRGAYSVATVVQWAALVLAGVAIPDRGDGAPLDTVLMRWFGVSDEVSTGVFLFAFAVVVVAYAAALTLAIVGIVRGRRAAASTTERAG